MPAATVTPDTQLSSGSASSGHASATCSNDAPNESIVVRANGTGSTPARQTHAHAPHSTSPARARRCACCCCDPRHSPYRGLVAGMLFVLAGVFILDGEVAEWELIVPKLTMVTQSHIYHRSPFFKIAQQLDLRCVLLWIPAPLVPWVPGVPTKTTPRIQNIRRSLNVFSHLDYRSHQAAALCTVSRLTIGVVTNAFGLLCVRTVRTS